MMKASFLLLIIIAATPSLGFINPTLSIKEKRYRAPAPHYVIDPAALPDPDTVSAVVDGATSSSASFTAPLDAARSLLFSPSGFGIAGVVALCIRLYTYFTVQSMMARLVTVLVTKGTVVEVAWGNSLRNLFYYENKMEKLIVPTGDPKNIDTVREVIARLQTAAKATYNIVAYEEDFDDLDLEDESIDCIVSTYMMNKKKNPAKTFEKAMRLLKDGGAFIFVEPIIGEGPLAGVRSYFGKIHLATGAFGRPDLDFKGIVERWAAGPGAEQRIDIDVEIEENGFLFDPHLWGVIYKKSIKKEGYEPTGSEIRKMKRRVNAKNAPRGFERRSEENDSKSSNEVDKQRKES